MFAVKLNDALGGLLTYKLAGEDAVSSSGTYCVWRSVGCWQDKTHWGRGGGVLLTYKLAGEDAVSLLFCDMLCVAIYGEFMTLPEPCHSNINNTRPSSLWGVQV
jgi:hypothetical protein